MAKHKHRERDPIINETKNNSGTDARNIPFGIDPMQLMGLLGGNFDMNNMGNMLSSMNTNGFNLGNLGSLGSIAQMMGLNLDNNFSQGTMPNFANDINKNTHTNVSQNKNSNSNNVSTSASGVSNLDKNKKKNTNINTKNVKENDANLNFLISLRSYAHPDRIKFIDKIIEAYKSGGFDDI
jgi:hypothetical protein